MVRRRSIGGGGRERARFEDKYFSYKLIHGPLPTHDDANVRGTRRLTSRAHDTLIALARLLARRAARELIARE
jgi:hypothetical protein